MRAASYVSPTPLAQPVSRLGGVGPERAAQLARLEIHTIEDLLLHRPRRYEDRRQFRPIAELSPEQLATTRGMVVACGVKYLGRRQKSVVEVILDDGTGRLHCRWWNMPFMEKYFAVGDEVVAFGKLTSVKPRTMDHPETEVVESGAENFIHTNRIVPVYPLTEGLSQRWLRGLIWRTLERYERYIADLWTGVSPAGLSENVGQWPSRAEAVRMLHFPERIEDTELARRRLALDEFFVLQRQIQLRRKRFEVRARAVPCAGNNRLIKPFLSQLGFKLTASQTRVLREIRKDLGGAHPMRRLLQGDVGSGKTVVAACTALMAVESGYNVALMAPTEILAEQHYNNFRRWFEPLGVKVGLRTGSRKTTARDGLPNNVRERQSAIANPTQDVSAALVIGTHALISEGFEIPNLGLVIIDEQHKFGVAQREQLVRKGRYPHLLVMTATPIPRTLGLTLYGDLDVSVIDEMPPGRGRVRTFVRSADKLPKVWEFMRRKLAEGRQAYIVYPRVEDTGSGRKATPGPLFPDEDKHDDARDSGTIKAVTKEYEALTKVFAPFRVGLLHGRLPTREKESVMEDFRAGKIHALLATSLIEVGVDVPNATILLVENAEQFGLAQLHQLRGRIGRGAQESYCILISSSNSPEARQRLNVLAETTDGFLIAEADLRLRGPGELLGRQQSGLPKFKFGDLRSDLDLIRQARQLAVQTLSVAK